MARVLYLDPYHGPSHGALYGALSRASRHQVTLLTMPPRKWKWRMRGAALALEPRIRALGEPPELLVATDMLNLPELLGLLRDRLPPRLPVITYFHENQITYPLPSRDERDFHFGLVNIHTALASDKVVFNSAFHRDEFLEAVPGLLRLMPDHRPEGVAERIRARSDVLPIPVEAGLDPPPAPPRERENLILWNHRWEDDKDPKTFFDAVRALDRRGTDFGLLVLGQSFSDVPACFAEARRDLAHRIVRWGFVPSRDAYLREVARCRVVVSTARHEFYGLAVREAVRLGCYPLLPRRVVYPEMVGGRSEYLYDTDEELAGRLEAVLGDRETAPDPALCASIAGASLERIVTQWDDWFDRMA